MNNFYTLNKPVQWSIAIFMFALMLLILGFWIGKTHESFVNYLGIFLIIPIGQFLATPFLTLIKVYIYQSPMLLVYMANPKKYDLHNGTSFDYLMVMRKVKPGRVWRNAIIRYHLQGLLNIIDKIESGQLTEAVIVQGSSYFFSSSTAERFGFKVKAAGWYEKLNIIVNYLDLTWMYSLAHGRFRLPKIQNTKTAIIEGGQLVLQKNKLERMLSVLT